nr:right-handed parallel beta-helix repeat-containing protein [Thalassoroseus pseudoceratinae]
MRTSRLTLTLITLMLSTGNPLQALDLTADFYVSPSGSDDWSGTLATPNEQQTDGPFQTLQCARDAVRELQRKRSGDIEVLIRGGTYRLEKTVVFGLQDSGQTNSTITYAAYPGETPVFSAGQEIREWTNLTNAQAALPKEAIGKVLVADVSSRFRVLFDSEGLLPRARSKGFIPRHGGSRNQFYFPAGRLRNWPNIEDVEIVVRPHHAWIVNILPLKSVDEQRQIAQTSIDATYAMNPLHFLKQTESCWVENTLEELDEPGEWVLNSKEGKLYLWPRNDSPVLAPQLTELIRIEGEIDKAGPEDKPVRNLQFRGLTFTHGDRYQLAANDAGLQHDWDMHDKPNALVRLRGTKNCVIEQCRFIHSGSGAIRVDLRGQENSISGNVIEHIGGTGILLCGYGPGTKDVNRKNNVSNNHIHHTGQIYWHSPGIMIWQSGENRVANNLIHHTPYTGIILSGCMTHFFGRQGRELGRTIRRHELGRLPKRLRFGDVRPYLHTHENVVEYNEIHHAMELLGDGNGIYIRGAGSGNVIRRNYIHHLVAPTKMQAAIRTDGGQRDTLIAENLIYKCTSQGIILKLNNRCENNIIADVIAPPRGYYLSLREGPMTGATIKRNIFYSSADDCTFIDELPPGRGRTTEDRRGRTLAASKQADTNQNIYFCAANRKLGVEMLKRQHADGVDVDSLAVDPMFVDAAHGDFQLKSESPALMMGFVPFDMSKVGLTDER